MRKSFIPGLFFLEVLLLTSFALIPISSFASDELQPPQFRLPAYAAPLRYSVDLSVAPDHDTFNGIVDIDLTFKQASPVLWLNADKIKVKEATLNVGGQVMTAKVLPQPKDLVGFSFDHPVGPGPAKIHIVYEGEISRKDMQGIFQVKDGDQWYIYSQFENIGARRAFPCFDEPGYKVPWQVTLHVPEEDGAYSNTPPLSETSDAHGTKTVKFAETKPFPSYLVAIAVGPMEIVDAGHAGANNTAIRIIVPRGHRPEAQFVASTTPDIVNLLEKYFGIPYPYEKLDQVAIPLAGYAMEHPGLVTYGAGFFLMKSDQAPLSQKRGITSVIAHELAHQWFGDLVTTAWWDDIWLNEGFASWMANKIVNQYHPEWKMDIGELNSYQRAMDTDALVSSRKVRQPILSNDDIANAFDGITYDKGSALLNMFEMYMGPEKFQAGVRSYLKKYSWGNATSADFLNAIAAGDPSVAKAFSTFLDQPGVPLVTAKLTCNSDPQLSFSQQRFLPRGSQGSSDQLWNVPVCVKYPNGSSQTRQCVLMTDKTATMTLKAKSCPAWTYDNAGQSGYYRVLYGGAMLTALVKDDGILSPPEHVGLIGDLAALSNGYIPLGQALALVPKFTNDPSRQVVSKTLSIAGGLQDHLVPDGLKPKYQRYLSDLYKPRAEQLGWQNKPTDDDDARLLRPILINVMANQAEDPEFIAQAKKLALAWFDDHQAVDRNMLDVVMTTAAAHGDRALYDRLHDAAKKATDEETQRTLLAALGSFRDPELAKMALSNITANDFDIRVSVFMLFPAAAWPGTRDIANDFVRQNWDKLVAQLPDNYGSFLPFVARRYCDEQHRADAEAFFKDRVTKTEGGPRNLQQTLEAISLCAANKEANQESVAQFLKSF